MTNGNSYGARNVLVPRRPEHDAARAVLARPGPSLSTTHHPPNQIIITLELCRSVAQHTPAVPPAQLKSVDPSSRQRPHAILRRRELRRRFAPPDLLPRCWSVFTNHTIWEQDLVKFSPVCLEDYVFRLARDREAKKEGFRKYLESSGVLDTLTKALVALYEENDKPSSAVEFVQQKLGGPSISDYEKLKAEKLDLQLKYNELLETHKETSRQLEELKNLKIDAPWN
ncbi:hypothetical protein VPH35_024019 [Triticum aestivum]